MNPLTWLSLKEWLIVGAIASIIGLHYWGQHLAIKDALAEQHTADELAKATAIIEARKEWDKNQATLDMLGYLDHAQYAGTIAAIDDRLKNIRVTYHAAVEKQPLSADCRATPDRVHAVNDALSRKAGSLQR